MIGAGIRGSGVGRARFSPALFFSRGEQGGWYDPSDLSTLFQDAAGATPVTDVGQSVRLMRDKSGRGNHATAPSDAARPVLQQDSSGLLHLLFDGSNNSMSTSAIDFTGTDKMAVFAGVRKSSDAAAAVLVELSASVAANNGAFAVFAPDGAAPRYLFQSKGLASAAAQGTGYTAPITNVITGIGDISGDSATLRVNGTQAATSGSDQGSGNFGNHSLFIGSRNNASLRFNGRLYGLIVRGAIASDSQIRVAERWMARKTGVIL
jgi:hypothetical protein